MNEQDQFLKDLEPNLEDPFAPPVVEETKEEEKEEVEDETKLKNRQARRLAKKLEEERHSSMQLAARLDAITEAQKARDEGTEKEYLKEIERIYGTESPEAVMATDILKRSLTSIEERAVERALDSLRKEREQEQEALKKEERSLDEMVENIEDELDITMSETQQKGFFKLLEKLSPKDEEGNVIAYADPYAVWEEYQARTKKTDTKAKDLSARSMTQSGASKESNLDEDSAWRYLSKELGW